MRPLKSHSLPSELPRQFKEGEFDSVSPGWYFRKRKLIVRGFKTDGTFFSFGKTRRNDLLKLKAEKP
jgi:hypothetical protein